MGSTSFKRAAMRDRGRRRPLVSRTRIRRLGQRAATFFFLAFGAPAAALGAGHGAW
jgi:hypothetical protein